MPTRVISVPLAHQDLVVTSDFDAPTRQCNRSCAYEAYVPDPLEGRNIVLDGEVAADVADAETAIACLNQVATSLVDTEALARALLRPESVASSKIEGLEVGARRLLRAEAARGLGEPPTDLTALEVLGNIDAMVAAIRSADEGAEPAGHTQGNCPGNTKGSVFLPGRCPQTIKKPVPMFLEPAADLHFHGGRYRT